MKISNFLYPEKINGARGATLIEYVMVVAIIVGIMVAIYQLGMANNKGFCNATMGILYPTAYADRRVGWLFNEQSGQWRCQRTPTTTHSE